MQHMAFETQYAAYQERIEEHLQGLFPDASPREDLYDAMRYSLLAGGKRVRPILTLEFARISGLGQKWENALCAACSVELIHTYSLIHDDLPCMDDDSLRRGKPTNHKVYGETMAVLAGDALQPAAYEHILSCPTLSQEQRLECALLLSEASGPHGMVGGQVLDTLHAPQTEAELMEVHRLKTGAMIRAACMMGCVCGGENDPAIRQAAHVYAENVGMAFQIKDDILDVTATTQTLGKPVGSDAVNGKATFLTVLGEQACETLVRDLTERAKAALYGVFPECDFLCRLADLLAGRNH